MAEVSLQSVTKRYRGGIVAVRDLDLRVADGELLVLVGPSGCGKTTTLRLVAGLERPTAGTIRIGGASMNGRPPRDRDVAMVFQDYALYPHMTVRRNLAFALTLRKVGKDEIAKRVAAAADLLRLGDLLDRKPGDLSGGEQQRAALGRAIAREPGCLLLDEPLSNLDAALRIELRGELRSLHERLRRTTIHVTHDRDEALALGDRVAVMRAGAVEQIGTPDEVRAAPANAFVATFLGLDAPA
jgi:multiple sugar transport system ATP-binding protein